MITLADVLAAQNITRPHTWHTPLLPSPELSHRAGGHVHLKLECWQRTGSFKVRGALNLLANLYPAHREPDHALPELVTASAGNHGLGVAYASQILGLPPVIIFVPESAPATKVNRLAGYDCDTRRAGADYDACHALAEDYVAQQVARGHAARYISAYDDPLVIAGQGTAGLEILADLPQADLLLVPIGGGGLIAGLAIAARAINAKVRIVGLQPEASPAALLSLRDGRAYETYPAGPTICDGLAGGFGRVPFELAGDLIDDVLIVPEDDILRAVAWLAGHEQLIVEGSGAIAVAPLLSGQLQLAGKQAAIVLTGRNIDAALLQQILEDHSP